MSVAPEPASLGSHQALFDYAVNLHCQAPDAPLPRGGKPYADDRRHRHPDRPKPPKDPKLAGADAARILSEYFANPAAAPHELANAFHDVDVPIHHNEHIATAARAADPVRVRATGRWLVRHSADRCSVVIGLALIAVVGTAEDIPLIQTIGLLSDTFGALAAQALQRLTGGTAALLWLADRVEGWGRVYVVEALCRLADPAAKPWLLRRAINGEYLNGYFAGKVAEATAVHKAITDPTADDDLVDHTGRLLAELIHSRGMSTSIEEYPYAAGVLDAYVRRLGTQQPTARRFATAATLADYLHSNVVTNLGWPQEQLDRIRGAYMSVLDRDDWCEVVRRAIRSGDEHLPQDYLRWLARTSGLRAFTGIRLADEE